MELYHIPRANKIERRQYKASCDGSGGSHKE